MPLSDNSPDPSSATYLDQIVHAQKQGKAIGITSICSSNLYVIQAAFRHALSHDRPVLIESTCNQVNQFGGYSGMTPSDFVAYTHEIASQVGLPTTRLILGGDHLGPYPWQNEPVAQAMDKARSMVRDYVHAGYIKIHIDASMKCLGEPADPLQKQVAAHRTAELIGIAEAVSQEGVAGKAGLRYVIGTEVPAPGGIQEKIGHMAVSQVDDVRETIEMTKQALRRQGLQQAWERIIAVVVHPGVEFGDQVIYDYDPTATKQLKRFIGGVDHLVYEAHSTDYQTAQALKNMVADHFAILKVGPALTFSLREALYALERIEKELLAGKKGIVLSNLWNAVENAMLDNPIYWHNYYGGSATYQRFARHYSRSDRIRYYWSVPKVQIAVEKLLQNLSANPPPLSLISQFFPQQYTNLREQGLETDPLTLIYAKLDLLLSDYTAACGRLKPQQSR